MTHRHDIDRQQVQTENRDKRLDRELQDWKDLKQRETVLKGEALTDKEITILRSLFQKYGKNYRRIIEDLIDAHLPV